MIAASWSCAGAFRREAQSLFSDAEDPCIPVALPPRAVAVVRPRHAKRHAAARVALTELGARRVGNVGSLFCCVLAERLGQGAIEGDGPNQSVEVKLIVGIRLAFAIRYRSQRTGSHPRATC
jgi:hypothetical protein